MFRLTENFTFLIVQWRKCSLCFTSHSS